LEVVVSESNGKNGWGASVVRWRELATITVSLVCACGMLGGWVVSKHELLPHAGAATVDDVKKLSDRIDRQEKRHGDALRRIEEKLDRVLEQ